MKKQILFFSMLVAALGASAQSNITVNREKYPDYVDPQEAWEPEPSLLKYVQMEGNTTKAKAIRRVTAEDLPDHWNNAETKYFPPVFNQVNGSCGSASRIGYMFTHEINSLRDVDGSLMVNRYPTHFVWHHTYNNDGKDEFVTYIGVPNAEVYGGYTYSNIFGSFDWSDDCIGFMQGYDRWFNAMQNRMTKPTSNPMTVETEAGRLAAKAWLYNHAGDNDFKAGGLIGLGVASGGTWKQIPTTTANKAAKVNGMYYVHSWGTSVDHAVTMVGWDDRIEFDLDGNGIAGEKDKDEVGAWIVVNSWGGWLNNGFVYCPYANAGPVGGKHLGNFGGYWSGELYHARKNFRPFRTLKMKIQYSRRSEIKLQAGISTDLNATKPEAVTDLHYFRYAGDGNSGNTNPAPEVPMLGKWADGQLHYEAMEFGYDLTDLSAGFDRNQSLKYFFIVNTRSWAEGEGKILGASIIDYEKDLEGIETPFDLGEAGEVEILNAGKQTIISVIVHGAAYYAPNSLSINDGRLSWMAPDRSSHTVDHYNVYYDQYKIAETKELFYDYDTTTGDAVYSVTAVYEDGTESSKVSVSTPVASQGEENKVVTFDGGGFTIPGVFDGKYDKCTIEFAIKPTAFSNWNCAAGPGWGTWYQHFDSDGKYYCGWNTDGRVSFASNGKAWQYISIVVDGSKMTTYINGVQKAQSTFSNYSGVGGFGDFTFKTGSNGQSAKYDEIRIWNVARTADEIKGGSSTKRIEYVGSLMPEGLLAYYKGDTFMSEDGNTYLRDCVGGNHAQILDENFKEEIETTSTSGYLKLTTPTKAGTLTVNDPGQLYTNTPVTLTAKRNPSVNTMSWSIPALGLENVQTVAPTVTFDKEGTFDVTVSGTDYKGNALSNTIQVTVVKNETPLDATFKPTATLVNAGDRVSFIPNTLQTGCSYKWHIAGAEVEDVNSVSAGATYKTAGVHKATLTVSAPDGRTATESVDITVRNVAPVANFEVDNSILNKGEQVTMTSTSKYDPTGYEWIIANSKGTTVVKPAGSVYKMTPEESGLYTVTLKAINAVGQNSVTKENAFVVANDDSKNGLLFGDGYKTARCDFKTQPIAATEEGVEYTIDFWAKVNKLSNNCLAIGCADTWELFTDEGGYMYLQQGTKGAVSNKEYVIAGEWHNYCIKHSKTGQVTFWRDGEQFGTGTTGNPVGMPQCKHFSIGTLVEEGDVKGGNPFIGTIDELRIWGKALTGAQMKKVINQHLDADDEAEKALMDEYNLLAYYDFNQNGGETIPDRTSNGNDLTRYYFGPEGDAWGLSKGVFTLDFNTTVQTDVTSSVLKNYKRSFTKYTTTVNNSTASRFYKIKEWTLENTTVDGSVTTGVHVDTQKSSDFTCTTGWDGFGNLTNHKAYQVLDLEPGFYTLTVTFGQHGAAGESYLVAAEGTGLPDADALGTALGYNALTGDASSTCSMQFLVDEQKSVSLGVLVGSMSGKAIFTIQKFQLKKSPVEVVVGVDEVQGSKVQAPSSGIYDLQGRKLQRVNGPGMYIVNGKKVLVK